MTQKHVGRTSFPRPPTPYERYMIEEDIPIHRGMTGARDGRELARGPWKRRNAKGAFIELAGLGNIQGLYTLEIAQGSGTAPEHHLFEEVFVVLEGKGHTEVWTGDGPKDVVKWSDFSVFTVPLNAQHRHVASQSGPAVLLVANNAPPIMQVYRSRSFVFGCDYRFTDRYNPGSGYYDVKPLKEHPMNGRAWNTNALIPDVRTVEVPWDGQRGAGHHHFELQMGGNHYEGFVAEYESGTYSRAHAHGPGAILVCVKGGGYTLSWPKRFGTQPWATGAADEVIRTEYGTGGFVSAAPGGSDWFHAHFATSREPFRVCTMSGGTSRPVLGKPGDIVSENQDMNEGGDSIGYADEDPMIREIYKRALAANGVSFKMAEELYRSPSLVGDR